MARQAAAQVIHGAVTPELDWELLYDMHAAKLRRVIQRRVGSALAEDVLQETFLRAFKCRATVDPDRPIGPWLITIALRTAFDLQRRQLRTVETATADEPAAEPDELGLDALEDELLSRARRMGIRHAFASLNTRQRRLLQLVTFEGLSYEGVAHAEDMTTDAVKSALARARTNFKTSYLGFERESGLFGAAALVGVLHRLRDRLQRYQALAGEHLAGVGAAAATVAVIAVAAAPAVRQVATHATEAVPTTAHTPGPSAPTQPTVVASTPPAAAAPTPEPPSPGPATTAAMVTTTTATAGTDGTVGTTRVDGDTRSDHSNTRSYADITIDCTANTMGRAVCFTVDAAVGPPTG